MEFKEIAPHLFRTEYSKIVAVLCKTFQLKHIEVAEDIASETFLKASESWPTKGLPENPTAWLYTVAKNKAKDHFRHLLVFETQVKPAVGSEKIGGEPEFEFSDEAIMDSQLAMMFAVCNSCNPIESQICLALQILCSFSVEEIASAFLAKPETIKKRLLRARANLREENFQIQSLNESDIKSRLDTVLKAIYLLFNEGYFSKSNSRLIRKELCSESVRLAFTLTENSLTDTPKTNALLALMCFQSSRLEARVNQHGEAVLFDEQNKELWDKSLIERGNYYLVKACKGNEIFNYHIEASIAYWHSTPTDENKWHHILQLYDQLILIEYSPITALNRTYAIAQVYGHESAIAEAKKLNLSDNSYYHGLLGYLYAHIDKVEAVKHYEEAIRITKSHIERQTLIKQLELIRERNR